MKNLKISKVLRFSGVFKIGRKRYILNLMSDTLNQRSDKFTIILNDNECNLFKTATNIVRELKCCEQITPIYIACIKHDKDIDIEHNCFKTIHYHLVVQFDRICRIGTIINLLSDIFKCNSNQITIDKCNSLCMQTRYLIHLDDFDKAQYFKEDISTNDIDVVNSYLSLVIVRDLHDLISVVKHYNYVLEDIMCGISNYDKWRKYIIDLINDHRRRF